MNLNSVKNIILKTIDVEKIIIYGSYAWGIPDENSDLDLFIVTNSKEDEMMQTLKVNKALFPRDYSLDLYIIENKKFQQREKKNKFIQKILNDGKELYNKS